MAPTDRLRKQLRARRRELSEAQQRRHAHRLRDHLLEALAPRPGQQLAGYLPFDGEADPLPFLEQALALGCRVALPVIVERSLRFAAWEPGHPCRPNRYGIPEPEHAPGDTLEPQSLDLVLTPLVAFDGKGHRLGMGAGFYDRSFDFLRSEARPRHPRLIGLAHGFQRLDSIDAKPWDVPLDAVVTEDGLEWFDPNRNEKEPGP